MTIDEAIAHAREKSDKNSGCWKRCTSIKDCKTCEQEHEQLAEWLEELKEIKSNGRYVQGNKAGQKIGYRNAIDDYNKELKEYLRRFTVHYVSDADFDYVAEQLKAGRSDE